MHDRPNFAIVPAGTLSLRGLFVRIRAFFAIVPAGTLSLFYRFLISVPYPLLCHPAKYANSAVSLSIEHNIALYNTGDIACHLIPVRHSSLTAWPAALLTVGRTVETGRSRPRVRGVAS